MTEFNSVLITENELLKKKNLELYKKNNNLKRNNLRLKNTCNKQKELIENNNLSLVKNIEQNINLDDNEWEDLETN